MGKDRQEKKLKKSRRVESDRDQSLGYPGATKLESTEGTVQESKITFSISSNGKTIKLISENI